MLPFYFRRHYLPRFNGVFTLAAQPVSSSAAAALATSSHAQFAHERATEQQRGVPLDSPSYLIWGANTGVGKTLVSVGLAHAAQRLKVPFLYLKPVQTGFPADSDARLVAQASGAQLLLGAHAAEQAASAAAFSGSNHGCSSGTTSSTIGSSASSSLDAVSHPAPPASDASQSRHAQAGDCYGTGGTEAGGILQECRVEHAWGAPVSPHVAVQQEGRPVADDALCDSVTRHMRAFHNQLTGSTNSSSRTSSGAWPSSQAHHRNDAWPSPNASHQNGERQLLSGQGQDGVPMSLTAGSDEQELQRLSSQGMVLVESAGGVASPSPSGRLMCDTLRPLRLPAILVGDPRLGGISATISAYESLLLRGYDTEVILFMDQPTSTTSSLSTPPPPDLSAPPSSHHPSSGSISSVLNPIDPCTVGSMYAHAPRGTLTHHADPCAEGGINAQAVRAHLSHQFHSLGRPGPRVMSIPACPPPPSPPAEMHEAGGGSGAGTGLDTSLVSWLQDTAPHFDALVSHLSCAHAARMAYLHSMRGRATSAIWWPFTQHSTLQTDGIQVIDSRWGDSWQTLYESLAASSSEGGDKSKKSSSSSSSSSTNSASVTSSTRKEYEPSSLMVPLHDACSSWWTQAATSDHHAELSRAVAYATGRYLHVMFPENVHQAALEAAEHLLQVVGGSWAKRVFFSDDGSTAVEVALKMAFRAFMQQSQLDLGKAQEGRGPIELQVVGLANAYHGDTLGAMDCVPPSPFNRPAQAPWYRGRGLFFEPPYVAMEKGSWQVVRPTPAWWSNSGAEGLQAPPQWSSLHDVLSPARDGSDLARAYRQHIEQQLDEHESKQASSSDPQRPQGHLAALVMEPLLQGAGGMLMVDPQFQRELVAACRARGMMVIFDEVMTGGFRLGAPTAASLLCLQPDIACFAKLVTGGALPMAATLTTEHVFKAFEGDSKMQALLHGHSYTAYPAGCAAIVAALRMLTSPTHNPNLTPAPTVTSAPAQAPITFNQAQAGPHLDPLASSISLSQVHNSSTGHTNLDQSEANGVGSLRPGQPCCHPCLPHQAAATQPSAYCRRAQSSGQQGPLVCGAAPALVPLWREEDVVALSHHPAVVRLVAIGTLLALQVCKPQHALPSSSAPINSYASSAGGALQVAFHLRDVHGIFARPLGDVVYIMVPPTTPRATCDRLLSGVRASLDRHLTGAMPDPADLRDGYIV